MFVAIMLNVAFLLSVKHKKIIKFYIIIKNIKDNYGIVKNTFSHTYIYLLCQKKIF